MSPKLNCQQKLNVTKTEMSPILKFHQNKLFTKTEKWSKLKYRPNRNFTIADTAHIRHIGKTEILQKRMSPKFILNQYSKVSKTGMSPKLICHQIRYVLNMTCFVLNRN